MQDVACRPTACCTATVFKVRRCLTQQAEPCPEALPAQVLQNAHMCTVTEGPAFTPCCTVPDKQAYCQAATLLHVLPFVNRALDPAHLQLLDVVLHANGAAAGGSKGRVQGLAGAWRRRRRRRRCTAHNDCCLTACGAPAGRQLC